MKFSAEIRFVSRYDRTTRYNRYLYRYETNTFMVRNVPAIPAGSVDSLDQIYTYFTNLCGAKKFQTCKGRQNKHVVINTDTKLIQS